MKLFSTHTPPFRSGPSLQTGTSECSDCHLCATCCKKSVACTKASAGPGLSLDQIKVFHPELSVTCSPSFPFTGVYQATHTFQNGMPTFLCDGPDPHVIEYHEQGACWYIRQCSTGRALAVSCAVSLGFPAPIVWTLLHPSFPNSPSLHNPIAVSDAGLCHMNGLYFPFENGTSPGSACARRLRSEACLSFSAAENHWVLSSAAHGPCYFYRPNPSQSSASTASEAHCADIASRTSDSSSACKDFPQFDDGVWEAFPICASLQSPSVPKCSKLEICTRPIPSLLSFKWSKLDRTSQSFLDLPLTLVISASSATSDAALFEGEYKLVDWRLVQRTSATHVLFSNDESGNQLLLVISSLKIERVRLTVDGEVLFELAAPVSPSQDFAPLSPLLMGDLSFSIDLFRSPLVTGDAPAFKLHLPKGAKPLSKKAVIQPHMTPMFTDPACISSIKEMMANPDFDARSLWKHTLARMSGHADVVDSNSLHRLLVRCINFSLRNFEHAHTINDRSFPSWCQRTQALLRLQYSSCNTVKPFRDTCRST